MAFSARVLHTKHLTKKRKTWCDGYVSCSGQRTAILFDEQGSQLATARVPCAEHWSEQSEGSWTSDALSPLTDNTGLAQNLTYCCLLLAISVFEGFLVSIDEICSPDSIPVVHSSSQVCEAPPEPPTPAAPARTSSNNQLSRSWNNAQLHKPKRRAQLDLRSSEATAAVIRPATRQLRTGERTCQYGPPSASKACTSSKYTT